MSHNERQASVASMNVKDVISEQKKLFELIYCAKTKDYRPLIGQKVKITKDYAQWLETHLDGMFTRPGSLEPENTDEYQFQKNLIKTRPVGTITSVKRDDDRFTLTTQVSFKLNQKEVVLCLDLSELQDA